MSIQKRVLVEFDEQSKSVTSKVTVEYVGDEIPSNDDILQQTQELFDKAQSHALNATMKRNR